MSLMTRFEHGAIRKGFILEEVSMTTSDYVVAITTGCCAIV